MPVVYLVVAIAAARYCRRVECISEQCGYFLGRRSKRKKAKRQEMLL